jgi:hypothetical protein
VSYQIDFLTTKKRVIKDFILSRREEEKQSVREQARQLMAQEMKLQHEENEKARLSKEEAKQLKEQIKLNAFELKKMKKKKNLVEKKNF